MPLFLELNPNCANSCYCCSTNRNRFAGLTGGAKELYVLSGADLRLARRIERAEAAHVVASAEALKPIRSDTMAEPIAGGVAVFAGVQSALTQAVGIGLDGTVPEADLERMEEFFRLRGGSCVIDLCPLANISILAFLQRHPYRLTDFNNVVARSITPNESFAVREPIREIHESERNEWARVICNGFSAQMPVEEEAVALIAATSKASRCWLAVENTPVAGAAMSEHNGVALLYGDATIPQARERGWQSSLITARLAAAQKLGCDLAAASVLPGSSSHRNYERAGFQVLYMRVSLTNEGI